jgi:uncharacterized protein YdhG (YjbR/CyaY superfamily)
MRDYKNIDEYISTFPKDIQEKLASLRDTIHQSAPTATETISYGMPTFKLNGNLIHFAAFKRHIGLYPTPSAINHFDKQFAKYVRAKGSVQFPLNEPLPLDLVSQIVEFRVQENLAKK